MAQRRFWNWKDDDLTADINQWLQGIIDFGRYRGFDAKVGSTIASALAISSVGMVLKLSHEDTGADRVDSEENWVDKFGVIVTKQGSIIQEYGSIDLPITTTAVGYHRIDLVIVSHQYTEVVGGEQAVYSVIVGTEVPTTQQAEPPTLNNSETQVIIGELYLPPETISLQDNGVTYTAYKSPSFANSAEFIEKENGFFVTDLNANSNKIVNLSNPTDLQDAATKFYVDSSIANNIVRATESVRGIAMLLSNQDILNQSSPLDISDDAKIVTLRKWKYIYSLLAASQNEVNLGNNAYKYITPKTLDGRTATENRKGIAKISTVAEVLLGQNDTNFITPRKLKEALPLVAVTVPIGHWDLSLSSTISIPHTLQSDWDKVVSSSVLIIKDNQSERVVPSIVDIVIDTVNVTVEIVNPTPISGWDSGASDRGFITFWIKKDLPPVQNVLTVEAGVDRVEEGSFIDGVQQSNIYELLGFAEAIGSPIAIVTWQVNSMPAGANVIIQNASNVEDGFTTDTYGVYVFNIEIENIDGDVASDMVTIEIVEKSNVPPVIDSVLGNSHTQQDIYWQSPDGLSALNGWKKATLNIVAHDDDGDTLSYEVIQVSAAIGGVPVTGSTLDIVQSAINPTYFIVHGLAIDYVNGASDGSWFVHLECKVDDGNGGTDTKVFTTKVVPVSGTVGGYQFSMVKSIDSNTDADKYDGFLALSNTQEVHTIKVQLAGDGILQIGGSTGQYISGVGVFTVNPNLISSNIPITFRMLIGTYGINATALITAYSINGTILDTESIHIINN